MATNQSVGLNDASAAALTLDGSMAIGVMRRPPTDLANIGQTAMIPTSLDALATFFQSGENVTLNCVTKTADYTMGATDYAVQADSSSAGVTITLPLDPTNGRTVIVGKSNATGNNVYIGRNGKKIQNASADIAVPSTGYASYTLQYDSTAGSWWFR